jgi:hypothetical protein
MDAASHGLRMLPAVCLQRLPRMADFAMWASACETAVWPASTFLRAYEANRRAAIETVIDADPVPPGSADRADGVGRQRIGSSAHRSRSGRERRVTEGSGLAQVSARAGRPAAPRPDGTADAGH